MHVVLFVYVADCLHDLHEIGAGVSLSEVFLLENTVKQLAPIAHLGYDIKAVVIFEDLVNLENVRMVLYHAVSYKLL